MQDKDIIIIGSGPAGLSAGINAAIRNKSVGIISNDPAQSGLYKAEKINNYLGLSGVSGAELLDTMRLQASDYDIEFETGKVLSIMPFSDRFMLTYGQEVASAAVLIIAAGVVPSSVYRGEEEFLGRGVSYCATCDGMLYRGKKVYVTGNSPDIEEEIAYLREIGCDVDRVKGKILEIKGGDYIESVITEDRELFCDGLFVLRKAISFGTLLPGIETENGFIKVDRQMQTSVSGVFAAGDCTGRPLQVAKAVGEGLVAGLSAASFIDNKKNDSVN